jgi:hypothetical protein
MVNLITNRLSQYDLSQLSTLDFPLKITDHLDEFNAWWNSYTGPIQLDTETNIVVGVYGWKGYLKGINKDFHEILNEDGERIPQERECYLVQIGDINGEIQWLFEIPEANEEILSTLDMVFLSKREKLIHNGLFDYTTIKWCFGIDIDNIRDTFLISQILNTGLEVGEDLPKGYHSLAGCAERYLNVDLSKEQQTTFNGNVLNFEQIKYAAIDVNILGDIYKQMMFEVEALRLQNVVDLECSLIRSYGDGMCENLYLNREEWSKTMHFQQAEVVRIQAEFHTLLKENIGEFIKAGDDLYAELKESENPNQWELDQVIAHCKMIKSFVQLEDKYDFKWSSPKLKKELIKLLFDEIQDDFKVKDYQNFVKVKLNDEYFDDRDKLAVLQNVLSRNFESAELYFINHHLDKLQELEVFIPAGTVLLNLNSPIQKLHLFSCIKPGIESTNKDVIAKINHPLAFKLKEYNKASKMATSYGQNFLNAINPDGMFRISGFKQILNTGRSSMDKLQLLPGQAVYRNPFKPNNPETGTREDGHKWVVVGADYASQEAVVAATFCNETSLMDAIAEGCDFHSTCASLMFPEEWKKLGGDPKPKGKPEDKTLQKFRNSSKVVSFGNEKKITFSLLL